MYVTSVSYACTHRHHLIHSRCNSRNLLCTRHTFHTELVVMEFGCVMVRPNTWWSGKHTQGSNKKIENTYVYSCIMYVVFVLNRGEGMVTSRYTRTMYSSHLDQTTHFPTSPLTLSSQSVFNPRPRFLSHHSRSEIRKTFCWSTVQITLWQNCIIFTYM